MHQPTGSASHAAMSHVHRHPPDLHSINHHVCLCVTPPTPQKGSVTLPDLHVSDSSEALLSGRKPPFRLLVRAVDQSGKMIGNLRHAVSEGFVVRVDLLYGMVLHVQCSGYPLCQSCVFAFMKDVDSGFQRACVC